MWSARRIHKKANTLKILYSTVKRKEGQSYRFKVMQVNKEQPYRLVIKYQATMDEDQVDTQYAYWTVPAEQ